MRSVRSNGPSAQTMTKLWDHLVAARTTSTPSHHGRDSQMRPPAGALRRGRADAGGDAELHGGAPLLRDDRSDQGAPRQGAMPCHAMPANQPRSPPIAAATTAAPPRYQPADAAIAANEWTRTRRRALAVTTHRQHASQSGAPISDCKKALEAEDGDMTVRPFTCDRRRRHHRRHFTSTPPAQQLTPARRPSRTQPDQHPPHGASRHTTPHHTTPHSRPRSTGLENAARPRRRIWPRAARRTRA